MTKPNDKREWWLIFEKGYSSWISDKPLFSADCEEIHVVAMADVQPLVEAATVIILTASLYDDCVGHIPTADLKNLRSALEKWNGK